MRDQHEIITSCVESAEKVIPASCLLQPEENTVAVEQTTETALPPCIVQLWQTSWRLSLLSKVDNRSERKLPILIRLLRIQLVKTQVRLAVEGFAWIRNIPASLKPHLGQQSQSKKSIDLRIKTAKNPGGGIRKINLQSSDIASVTAVHSTVDNRAEIRHWKLEAGTLYFTEF